MYCSKCGNTTADNAAFCSNCGKATYPLVTPVVGLALPNPSGLTAAAANYAPVEYAGFWLRVVAYMIDALVMGVCFGAVIIALLFLTGLGAVLGRLHSWEDPSEFGGMLGVTFIFAFTGIAMVGGWLYYAYLESSDWQATVGKKVLNLKVTDLEGRPISFARASGRYFGKIISGLIPAGIGYIMAGFTEKKQAIHDMIANCLVLRTP